MVFISPGFRIRCSDGKSFFANVISSLESPIFLPMSLFIQSDVLSPPSLDWIPGTTRGMLDAVLGVLASDWLCV